MIWSKQRFKYSFQLFPSVLKEAAPLLILLYVFQSIIITMNWLSDHPPTHEQTEWNLEDLFFFFNLLFFWFVLYVVRLLYIARSTQRQVKNKQGSHPIFFVKERFLKCSIECIKALISVMLYFLPALIFLLIMFVGSHAVPDAPLPAPVLIISLILIIPGTIRVLRLSFVGFTASFDQDCFRGEKSALKESRRLVLGNSMGLFCLICLMSFPDNLYKQIGRYSSSLTNEIYLLLLLLAIVVWIFKIYFDIYFSLNFFCIEKIQRWKRANINKNQMISLRLRIKPKWMRIKKPIAS